MKVKEFARLMDAFILQISDDVLREQLELALWRLKAKGEDTGADNGIVDGGESGA